ncbi:RNA-guided endonuclease IscB [Ruminococcus bicirculans (ex Wegman et al. 2014)]|uniref:RNA-guided endonuclease IscB n=1 Tax=Ruminococcus bicirculans (ex Wegman et al. 2014) TaxID=1160721 RepID=UPI00242ADD60|nr:RNA-guided endonuclease IscB [Ruminococcus bicirculans (ex Wegman et al. 2014)]MBS6631875.1 HNH endonuclease [Ruminococcus bicirculans (ex Wegman et al. 2014)]
MTNYVFVLDANGKHLSPTKEQKAWFFIRKKRATLVSKYPMVIQLNKEIPDDKICKDEIRCGIDDGGLHTGIALVQKCQTKNKVLFKGVIEQRNDVKHLMDVRRGYRRYHRYHKRYRPARFNNRSSSKKEGKIAPSILQKRQATIRAVAQLNKWINITDYWLEDVAIDIRALTDGFKPYKWQYQKSNRLDENIRKAVILRDGCQCVECGRTNCKLEVHHIKPRRSNGSNVLSNLITLCERCHQNTEGREELFMDKYFALLNSSDNKYLNYAQHVMIGKKWLREQLSSLGILHLTNGGDTANKRIDWNIEKFHSNDAICITNLQPDTCDAKEWTIKPMRRQSKAKADNVLGIKHRDLVEYTFKSGETHRGYVTALYPKQNAINFQSPTKHCKKVSAKKCRLLWKFNKIYWLDDVS